MSILRNHPPGKPLETECYICKGTVTSGTVKALKATINDETTIVYCHEACYDLYKQQMERNKHHE